MGLPFHTEALADFPYARSIGAGGAALSDSLNSWEADEAERASSGTPLTVRFGYLILS
jgi:hypothetical protein